MTYFECTTYRENYIVELRIERIDVGDATLECVDEFCYLGDMIGAGGGAVASSTVKVRCS